jgi:hypothetical protein
MSNILEEDHTELCEECNQGIFWDSYAWYHFYSGDRFCFPESNDYWHREIMATRHVPDCTDAVSAR